MAKEDTTKYDSEDLLGADSKPVDKSDKELVYDWETGEFIREVPPK